VAKTPSFRKKGKISVWIGVRKPDMRAMQGVDILKDLCAVEHYDLDDQEISAAGRSFPVATCAEVLASLSYSSSFLAAATEAAAKRKLHRTYWALAQYDFAYDPRRVRGTVAEDPLFLGVFDWNDAEDEEG
jgi:hypothetical protein